MSELVCYCFNYTAADIEQDIKEHGKSTIMEKIMTDKKAGRCQCKTKNPKGRWCLADVRQVVDNVLQTQGMAGKTDLSAL